MARKPKCRRVCRYPDTVGLTPVNCKENAVPVVLTVDEYEAIRLIDREGLSQEQCSCQLQVARTTAQKIYEQARRKLAEALVEGRPLRIEGGSYRICDGGETHCPAHHCCHKRR